MAAASMDSNQFLNQKIPIEEKLLKAKEYKEEGNALYKEKNIKGAIRKYHWAVLYLKGVEEHHKKVPSFIQLAESAVSLPPEVVKEVQTLKLTCNNNLAACLLQQHEPNYEKVIEYCNKVIEIEGTNTKALYRKGLAYFHLKDYEKSQEILLLAKKYLTTPDGNVERYIQLCEKQLSKHKEKEKMRYQGMFEKFAASENVNLSNE